MAKGENHTASERERDKRRRWAGRGRGREKGRETPAERQTVNALQQAKTETETVRAAERTHAGRERQTDREGGFLFDG